MSPPPAAHGSLSGTVNPDLRPSLFRQYLDLPAALHILCAGTFINRAGSFVMVFMTIYVSEQLKLGPTFATQCLGVFGLGSILSSLLGGQLADQFGRRFTMLLALWGGTTMLALMSVVSNGYVFMFSFFLFALIAEMYRPACAAMISDLVPPATRAQAFGLMYIAVNLGFAIAPPIGGFLAEYSFTFLFWGDALTTGVYGIVIVLFIKESRLGSNKQHRSDTSRDVPFREAFQWIRKDVAFLAYCGCNFLTTVVFVQAFSTLPIHLRSRGYTTADYGAMICLNGILIVLLQLPLTQALSRFNRVALIMVGELLLAIGFGLTAFATSTVMLIGTIIVWTLGEIVQAPFKQAIVADLAPPAVRARYMGVFTMSHGVALAVGPPLGGEILVRYGGSAVWICAFFVILFAIAVYSCIFRRLSHAAARRFD